MFMSFAKKPVMLSALCSLGATCMLASSSSGLITSVTDVTNFTGVEALELSKKMDFLAAVISDVRSGLQETERDYRQLKRKARRAANIRAVRNRGGKIKFGDVYDHLKYEGQSLESELVYQIDSDQRKGARTVIRGTAVAVPACGCLLGGWKVGWVMGWLMVAAFLGWVAFRLNARDDVNWF